MKTPGRRDDRLLFRRAERRKEPGQVPARRALREKFCLQPAVRQTGADQIQIQRPDKRSADTLINVRHVPAPTHKYPLPGKGKAPRIADDRTMGSTAPGHSVNPWVSAIPLRHPSASLGDGGRSIGKGQKVIDSMKREMEGKISGSQVEIVPATTRPG